MPKKFDFDYIILGSGIAGRTAALRLAESGAKVALVAGPEFGGSELSFSRLGLKTNFDFATSFFKIKNSPAIKTEYLGLNFNELSLITRREVERERSIWRERLEMANVTILSGSGMLLDRHWVTVHDDSDIPTEISATNIILATGTKPKAAEIEGLDKVSYLTPDVALNLDVQPKFVLIVGGGETGTELACHFARLGVRVLIMEKLERILPREDKDVSDAVTTYLKDKLDIMVVPNSKVIRLEQDAFSKRVVFGAEGAEKVVRVDCIVLATGSEPVLDYGLEQAHIAYRRSGIAVGPYFNTSAKNIFAIGDAIDSSLPSTPLRATLEAEILVANLLKKRSTPTHALRVRGGRFTPKYNGLPRRILVTPEVTTVGLNERDLFSRDIDFRQILLPSDIFPESAAYQSNGDGFVKLLLGHKNELYGASAVGAHTSAIIAKLGLAISEDIPLEAFLALDGIL